MNKRFFRNKTKTLISPEHLDYQFNKIVDYINIDLISYIENIITTATNGIPGEPLSVFSNIDNGTVGYTYINDIHIDDNLIALNKLATIGAGSILGSDYEGNVIPITATVDNMLLFRDFLTNVIFRKITSNDIGNNVLTGLQIGELASENFTVDTFIDVIPDASIDQNKLHDVANDKIAEGTVDFRHIGVWGELPYNESVSGQVLLSDFDDNSIDNSKIAVATITPANFYGPQYIYANNIIDRSIVEGHFKTYNANTQPPATINLANLIASNFGTIVNFPNQGINVHNVQLTRDKIALNCLDIGQFDQEVQNAINKYVQIKNKQAQPPVQVQKTKPDGAKYLGSFKLDPPVAVPNSYEGYKYVVITVAPARYPSNKKKTQTWDWYVRGFMTNDWIYMQRGDFIVIPLRITDKNLGIYEHSHMYVNDVPGLENALKPYPRETHSIPEFYKWR